MGFSIKHILELTEGLLLNEKLINGTIEHFVFDTRSLYFVKNSIFLAFEGKRTDGHNYIYDAYNKGIRNFIICKSIDFSLFENANFILVNNTTLAIGKFATLHRKEFNYPVIGITGSTGKTSIKEWIYQLLSPIKKVVKTPRSFNSIIGVPLSILRMREWYDIGIFEAGPAAIGDMDPLVEIIKPTIGVFSNIGDAHSTNFRNAKDKIREKLKLFKNVDCLIYCQDDKQIHELVVAHKIPNFTWSEGEESTVILLSKTSSKHGYILKISYLEKEFEVFLPYRSKASLENAMHCITCLLYLKLSITYIQEKLPALSKVNMRMEMKQGLNHCTILDDSYSADLDSFIIAMDFLERQSNKVKKTLVLTDFVETENIENKLYSKIADYINGSSIQKVICIGKDILELKNNLNNEINIYYFRSTKELIDQLWQGVNFNDEMILIKGSRKFTLNRLTDRLYERTHNTVLEVNMYGLAKNLKVYSELLNPNTKMMVMVKASAYGAGAMEVSKMLEYNNVDYLAVAYADEGIHLRKNGILSPIMVLNPEIPQFDHYFKYRLEPEIYSLKMLRKLAGYLGNNNFTLSIHVKIESGMNRLGFVDEELEELIQILSISPQIKVASIFSHLASSGEKDKDEFTHIQIKHYLNSYEKIANSLKIKPLRHILNSAGIIRFPEYHFEMVRLGAGLYGIDSYLPFREKITTVLSFKSRISQIKTITKGEAVGYSRGFIADKDMKIAIVSAGYADGIPRCVSNGKYELLIHRQKAPILGVVAMDMCMVDVTHIPNAEEEDEVTIFGNEYPVAGLAKAADTISYEIFTSISDRVKRIYYY